VSSSPVLVVLTLLPLAFAALVLLASPKAARSIALVGTLIPVAFFLWVASVFDFSRARWA
jgi:NADH:ubiquinone oxidoreductase subunit 4 (subunit M)